MTKYEYYLAAIPKPGNFIGAAEITYLVTRSPDRQDRHVNWRRVPLNKPPYSRELIAEWIDAILCTDIVMNINCYWFEERKLVIL
jgi:hypothetical protein